MGETPRAFSFARAARVAFNLSGAEGVSDKAHTLGTKLRRQLHLRGRAPVQRVPLGGGAGLSGW